MTRTTTANIGGMTFSVEEEAYQRLHDYLDALRRSLRATSYGDEVLADIEARAAELFQRKGAPRVVTLADVEALIAEIGTVEEVAGDDAASAAATAPRAEEHRARRRLYRNPDDMIVAGVASGIAAYFGVSATFVRVLFVVATLLAGSGIGLYLLLWLIVPLADTASEKLEMRGAPITLEGMERLVKERIDEAKAGRNASTGSSLIRDLSQGVIRVVGAVVSGAITLAGGLLTAGALAWAVMLTVALVALALGGQGTLVDFPLQEAFRGMSYALVLGAGYVAMLLPLVVGMLMGVSIIRRSWSALTTPFIALLALWIGAVVTLGGVVSHNLPQIEAVRREVAAQTIKPFAVEAPFAAIEANNFIRVKVVSGPATTVTAHGNPRAIARLQHAVENGTLVLRTVDDAFLPLCILCNQGALTVEVTMPELRAVTAKNASRVTVEDVVAADLSLAAHDAARLIFNGTATNVSATLSDASRMELDGSAASLRAQAADISRFEGDAFTVETATVSARDLARIVVRPTASLEATARDNASVQYSGTPQLKDTEVGNGRVRQLEF